MKKKDELSDPNSCLNKAAEDDELFVLIQRDEAYPRTVRFWVNLRVALGLNKVDDEKMLSALASADYVENFHLQKKVNLSGGEKT